MSVDVALNNVWLLYLYQREVLVLYHSREVRIGAHIFLLLVTNQVWILVEMRLVRASCTAQIRVHERRLVEERTHLLPLFLDRFHSQLHLRHGGSEYLRSLRWASREFVRASAVECMVVVWKLIYWLHTFYQRLVAATSVSIGLLHRSRRFMLLVIVLDTKLFF